jgi:hypothetical protein
LSLLVERGKLARGNSNYIPNIPKPLKYYLKYFKFIPNLKFLINFKKKYHL